MSEIVVVLHISLIQSKWSSLSQSNQETYQPVMLLRWHERTVSGSRQFQPADRLWISIEEEDITLMNRGYSNNRHKLHMWQKISWCCESMHVRSRNLNLISPNFSRFFYYEQWFYKCSFFFYVHATIESEVMALSLFIWIGARLVCPKLVPVVLPRWLPSGKTCLKGLCPYL